MIKYSYILVWISFLSLQSCLLYKNNIISEVERKKVSECYDSWDYKDIPSEESLSVLLHNPKERMSLLFCPNFVIGLTEKGDTIAIMDLDYEGKQLKRSSKIKVSPFFWSKDQKNVLRPMFTVYKNPDMNDLYCGVKIVYFAKIENVR